MEATAVDGNREQNIPPFTCRPPIIVGGKEVFPGYYDSVDKVVIECKLCSRTLLRRLFHDTKLTRG